MPPEWLGFMAWILNFWSSFDPVQMGQYQNIREKKT